MRQHLREQLAYRRAVYLLGKIEDKMGCNKDFEIFERQFNFSCETGKNWNLLINSMSKFLDALESDISLEVNA